MGRKKCRIDQTGVVEIFGGEVGQIKSTTKEIRGLGLEGNIGKVGKGSESGKVGSKTDGGFVGLGLRIGGEGGGEGGIEEGGKFIGFMILYTEGISETYGDRG